MELELSSIEEEVMADPMDTANADEFEESEAFECEASVELQWNPS